MRKIFDEEGNEIPHEEFAILALQAIEKVRRENEDRLITQIMQMANRKIDISEEFNRQDILMIIGVIKNHDKNHIAI